MPFSRRPSRSSSLRTSHLHVPTHLNLRRLIRRAQFLPTRYPNTFILALTTVILVLTIYAIAHTPRRSQPTWLVGVSKRNITPTERVWLSGFESRNRTADSLTPLDPNIPLYVRAISLQPSGKQTPLFVIVTLDVIGLHRDVSDDIHIAVETETGLSRSQLRLVASHTHSGPVIGKNLAPLVPDDSREWAKIERYALQLRRSVVEAVTDALEENGLTKTTAYFGKGAVALAVNRLQIAEKQFDGTNRGNTNDDVPVLWFVNVRGSVIAGLYGYSAHPTVLTGEFQYSGDYPAVTSAALEQKFEKSTWLFLTGCAGDQNIYPRGTRILVREHANVLAAVVANVVLGKEAKVVANKLETTLAYRSAQIALPFATRLGRKELRQLQRYPSSFGRRTAEVLFQSLDSDEHTPVAYPYPIAVADIGGLQLTFLGGEPTVGYCHSLRARGADWVVGYTDDVMGYVPTDAIMNGDGRKIFERTALYYGLPSVWKLGAENIIIFELEKLLQKTSQITT